MMEKETMSTHTYFYWALKITNQNIAKTEKFLCSMHLDSALIRKNLHYLDSVLCNTKKST